MDRESPLDGDNDTAGNVHETPASKKYLSSWRGAGMNELITPGSGSSPSHRTSDAKQGPCTSDANTTQRR